MTDTTTNAPAPADNDPLNPSTKSVLWSLPVLRMFAPPSPEIPGARTGVTSAGEILPWSEPGTRLRVKARKAAHGWYGPALQGAPTTTRQAEILNSALIAPPTSTKGTARGRDVLSRTLIAHDSVTAYNSEPREITSPNELVAGDVGGGKSSYVKTVCVLRPLLLAKRRAVVFDKKDQAGEGEYSNVVRRYGAEPIKFATDGSGTRLNLLDPMIARGTGTKGQWRLLRNIVQLGQDDQPLTSWQGEALRSALRLTLTQNQGRHRSPVPSDLLPNLGRIADDPAYNELMPDAKDELHEAGLSVRWVLNDLLDEYAGLLDGDTSSGVDLAHKLTAFDISQLPDDGPAVPVVMAIGHMWLLGRLRNERGYATTVVYEEGWHMIAGPSARLIKSNQKLSRGLAINNVFVMHKGTDIPKDSPGIAIIQEAQTISVFRQSRPEDAQWAVETFGFAPETAEVIQNLRNGHYVFKYGTHPETHVQHIRSQWEIEVTNTDEAMAGAGKFPERV